MCCWTDTGVSERVAVYMRSPNGAKSTRAFTVGLTKQISMSFKPLFDDAQPGRMGSLLRSYGSSI
jgi:hypothetical protein